MYRLLSIGLPWLLMPGFAVAQASDNRTIIGSGNEFLSAGSFAIRVGQYDEGIRLTELGLTRYHPSLADRASAFSNLCAAWAAKGDPDRAIGSCDSSLRLTPADIRNVLKLIPTDERPQFVNAVRVAGLTAQHRFGAIGFDVATGINEQPRRHR